MTSLLQDKLALVTGGSGTIGMAIAHALAEQGATIVLTARNAEKLRESVTKLLEVLPNAVVYSFPCNVANEDSVNSLFQYLASLEMTLSLLINNAGINVPGATTQLSAQDFESVLQVNVIGPFLCSKHALLIPNCRIINIGSLAGLAPRQDSAPYTTSKFALLGLTKSLALDGRANNVSVGIIHPGNVDSQLLTPEMKQSRKAEGFLQPSDVAQCVLTMALLPPSATILEMTVLPTQQPLVGRG